MFLETSLCAQFSDSGPKVRLVCVCELFPLSASHVCLIPSVVPSFCSTKYACLMSCETLHLALTLATVVVVRMKITNIG